MARRLAPWLLSVLSLHVAAFFGPAPSAEIVRWDPAVSYADSMRHWREERVARLTADSGWLCVVGLHWLEPGENSFGTDAGNRIVLPDGPARAGSFFQEATAEGLQVRVEAAPQAGLRIKGAAIEKKLLATDQAEKEDVLEVGRLRMWIIERDGRAALRVRDPESPYRKAFTGIPEYEIDPAYRVLGRLSPDARLGKIAVPNSLGYVDSSFTCGAVEFTLHGKACRLVPTIDSPTDSVLFFIFGDSTSGFETYGGGRFLRGTLQADGTVAVDFNMAYNPPCVFTPHATCPLPPEGNILPVAVRAGEKAYEGPDH